LPEAIRRKRRLQQVALRDWKITYLNSKKMASTRGLILYIKASMTGDELPMWNSYRREFQTFAAVHGGPVFLRNLSLIPIAAGAAWLGRLDHITDHISDQSKKPA